MIKLNSCSISELVSEVDSILQNFFDFNFEKKRLERFIEELSDELYVLIEYPYVDKLHRDSYYYHYSSKRNEYNRNTIRLAFFQCEISPDDFKTIDKKKILQQNFRGFLVIRPIRKIIGRNILSPTIFKQSNFYIRTTNVYITVNGIKLYIKGFPHSSQDTETVTCAEVSVWALMEYFGSKYPDYQTVLPSKMREILNPNVNERLIPSEGLIIDQISYLFRKFGFGSKIYVKGAFKGVNVFNYYSIINCYIESGIPVILGLASKDNYQGHAVVCIGRERIPFQSFENEAMYENISNVAVLDFNATKRNIIIIDDNHPPYRVTPIDKPTSYYSSSKWYNQQIAYIMVPHHRKIYMDAQEANFYVKTFLGRKQFITLDDKENLIYRLFLTSSRSLKYNLIKNTTIDSDLKEHILGLELPKFVWVVELTTPELINQNLAQGLILIDATEKQDKTLSPLIFSYYKTEFFTPSKNNDPFKFKKIFVDLHFFKMFNDNLTEYVKKQEDAPRKA